MSATRVHFAVAGLLGAFGVAASAYGAHAGGPNGVFGGFMLLAHASAIAAVSLARKGGVLAPRVAQLAVAALALGPGLFALGVTFRAAIPNALGPIAPIGGSLSLLGWLLVALAAVLGAGRLAEGR